MSPDLKYLAFTALLTASLWIPYVVCQVTTNGALAPANYVDPTPRPNLYSAGTPVVPRVVSLLPAGRAARSAFGGTTSVASPIHTRKRMVR